MYDTEPRGAETSRRPLLLIGVLLALFLAAADSTVVVAILPAMVADSGNPESYAWLLSAFLFTGVLATPLAGSAGDRFGGRPVMITALLVFAGASVLVAMAGDMVALIAARALQGAGAGALIAVAYTIIGQTFDARGRAHMQGLLSAVWGLAAVFGPLLGTLAESTVGWRWVFWINVPAAVVAGVFVLLFAPPGGNRGTGRFDVLAWISFALSLGGLLYLVEGPTGHGLTALAVAGVVMVSALVLHTLRVRANPRGAVVPTVFVTRAEDRIAALLSMGATVVLYAALMLLPLAVMTLGGAGRSTSGLIVVFGALGWVLGSAVCARVLTSSGPRTAGVTGGVLLVAGPLVLAFLPLLGVTAALVGGLLVGLGTGFVTATALVHAQNSAPPESMGSHTAAITLCRNIGAAVGINLFATVQVMLAARGGGGGEATSFPITFVLVAVVGLITALATVRLPRRVVSS